MIQVALNMDDGLPEMQIVFSASSALEIYRGEADLSRRVISYNLPGLSFREYLLFTGLDITSPKEGDFALEGLIIEVGGKTKNSSQVRHTENFMFAADDIETGEGNKVPVWLLGFLY